MKISSNDGFEGAGLDNYQFFKIVDSQGDIITSFHVAKISKHSEVEVYFCPANDRLEISLAGNQVILKVVK